MPTRQTLMPSISCVIPVYNEARSLGLPALQLPDQAPA